MHKIDSVSIKVSELNSRLNRVYDTLRQREKVSRAPIFAELWDLKEMALMQAKDEIVIPGGWLQELEQPERPSID